MLGMENPCSSALALMFFSPCASKNNWLYQSISLCAFTRVDSSHFATAAAALPSQFKKKHLVILLQTTGSDFWPRLHDYAQHSQCLLSTCKRGEGNVSECEKNQLSESQNIYSAKRKSCLLFLRHQRSLFGIDEWKLASPPPNNPPPNPPYRPDVLSLQNPGLVWRRSCRA